MNRFPYFLLRPLLPLLSLGLLMLLSVETASAQAPGKRPRTFFSEAHVEQPFQRVAILYPKGDYVPATGDELLRFVHKSAEEVGADAILFTEEGGEKLEVVAIRYKRSEGGGERLASAESWRRFEPVELCVFCGDMSTKRDVLSLEEIRDAEEAANRRRIVEEREEATGMSGGAGGGFNLHGASSATFAYADVIASGDPSGMTPPPSHSPATVSSQPVPPATVVSPSPSTASNKKAPPPAVDADEATVVEPKAKKAKSAFPIPTWAMGALLGVLLLAQQVQKGMEKAKRKKTMLTPARVSARR